PAVHFCIQQVRVHCVIIAVCCFFQEKEGQRDSLGSSGLGEVYKKEFTGLLMRELMGGGASDTNPTKTRRFGYLYAG
ncbi:hypothetical protein KHP32_09480, partial [Cronobacter sakazakii]|uniref:hypothetical protein n=1 Tax=Cronobacter sakazakii TaxID=28141 RepID=UPI001BCD18E6